MSINLLRSLKTKLFLWYLGSLLILTLVFFLFVHYWASPYGIDLFFIIFLILTIIGFITVYKIISSLVYLSQRMEMITRKNLDERILDIRRKDEIGELVLTFNRLLDRINEAFKRERQFIADVAHELKTPISTLKSSFELALERERTDQEYKYVIKEALTEINQLSSTLKNVLDLAWSETPNIQINKQKFNLSDLMFDLYDITQKMAWKKKVIVKSNIEKNIFISGFKDKLARSLLNIIDNAVKYAPEKGAITLDLEKVNRHVVIAINDTGQGILPSEIPHIFDRFYRGSSTDKVFGAGLGLAISQSIIALHHGHIKVESELGKGSTFIITLPF